MGERLEGKTSEGHCRRIDGDRCFREEEEWSIQAWRVPQLETEKEASHPGTQRRESLYEGALRLQGKARLQDRACVGNEEVEGDGELNAFQSFVFLHPSGRPHWMEAQTFSSLNLADPSGRSRWIPCKSCHCIWLSQSTTDAIWMK